MSRELAAQLRRYADSGDFPKVPSEVMRAAADALEQKTPAPAKPLRTYHCIKCLNEQKHHPSDFSPGNCPLCHRCQGTLRKGPGPGHNDEAPPTPEALAAAARRNNAPAADLEECPFDVPGAKA